MLSSSYLADEIINFKIFLGSTSKAMADKEKRGEDENTKIQYKYLKNENNFLDEIKNIFMVFEGLYLVKNKNLIENSGHKL